MMAKDRVLPETLTKISKNKVLYNVIIVIGIFSIILTIITGGALTIAGITGLIFSQIFFIINFTNP